jgi:hypothetical protein
MRGHTNKRLPVALAALGACATLAVGHTAMAQSATGTVTGRVLWGSCIRAIPLPMTPDAQTQPAPPEMLPPGPASRPLPQPVNGLPAGAVLVAVQNTNVSARTDEAGRFTLSGVPAGQYLTVAAGPVADSLSATAERPNVFLSGGQSMDIGTLALGGPLAVGGIACRSVAPGAAEPGPAPAPGDQSEPSNP